MSEPIGTLLIGWFLFVMIGGWLLVNALIDRSGRWLRTRLFSRYLPKQSSPEPLTRISSPVHRG